jgi:FkbM family methyltransferase
VIKEIARRLLRRVTYRLGYHNFDHLSLLLNSRLRKTRDFFIVQIGANDGVTYDPIHDFIAKNRGKVAGIMLEPLTDFFQQLTETYRDFPCIRTLQLAIHRTEPTMELFRVDPAKLPSMPPFMKGIASFDRSHHVKSNTPPEAIVAERVRCISMTQLIAIYDIRRIDLLSIDAEGYDSEILLSFPFETLQPAIIVFEHGLRDHVMSEAAFLKVVTLLNRHHYNVMLEDYDVIAHHRDRLAI